MKSEKGGRNKNYSPTGNWTRAFRVRAEYPSQLDHRGADITLPQYLLLNRLMYRINHSKSQLIFTVHSFSLWCPKVLLWPLFYSRIPVVRWNYLATYVQWVGTWKSCTFPRCKVKMYLILTITSSLSKLQLLTFPLLLRMSLRLFSLQLISLSYQTSLLRSSRGFGVLGFWWRWV